MANDQLYGRQSKLTISVPTPTPGNFSSVTLNQIEINGGDDPNRPGLRVQFKIKKSLEKEPNCSEITVSNLSQVTRGSLQTKGVKVALEAGYVTTGMTQIFNGDVRSIDHIRQKADWETLLKMGDGERSFQFARVNKSYSPGTSAQIIFQDLAASSGLSIGNVPQMASAFSKVYYQGYSVTGQWSKAFDKFVKSFGYTWSIQGGTLQVLAPDGVVGSLIPEISPESGLIGSPEMGTPEKKGKPALLKFKFLLQPTIPGGRLKLRSKRYNGVVKVIKCVFEGDTHGNDWYTTAFGVIVSGG